MATGHEQHGRVEWMRDRLAFSKCFGSGFRFFKAGISTWGYRRCWSQMINQLTVLQGKPKFKCKAPNTLDSGTAVESPRGCLSILRILLHPLCPNSLSKYIFQTGSVVLPQEEFWCIHFSPSNLTINAGGRIQYSRSQRDIVGEGIPVALYSDRPQYKSSFPQMTLGKLLNISEAVSSHGPQRQCVICQVIMTIKWETFCGIPEILSGSTNVIPAPPLMSPCSARLWRYLPPAQHSWSQLVTYQ